MSNNLVKGSEQMYYKATRMDGKDFYTGKIDYTKPLPKLSGEGEFPGKGWLHLATVPTECIGASWPCRLFEIEPAKDAIIHTSESHPHKIGVDSAVVVREIESWQFFGPQGKEVIGLLQKIKSLTPEQIKNLQAARDAVRYAARGAAWYAAWGAAWDAARYAARDAARDAAWDAARDAAWAAARALVVRDLIGDKFTQAHYDLLTRSWRDVMGEFDT